MYLLIIKSKRKSTDKLLRNEAKISTVESRLTETRLTEVNIRKVVHTLCILSYQRQEYLVQYSTRTYAQA
jgi:hypothetical protein